MNVVIVEDEPLTARRLSGMLQEIDPEITVQGIFDGVERTVHWLQHHPAPDLMFMDIHLSDGSGFEIFEKAKLKTPVIFITAYDEYALRAFKVNSVDYLLKPVSKRDLSASLEKFRTVHPSAQPETRHAEVSEMLELLHAGQPAFKTRFLVKVGHAFITIFKQEVAYFFTDQRLTYLVTKEAKKHPIDQTLEELEDQLDPKEFFRLNRQFIASVGAIAKVHNDLNRKLKIDLVPLIDEEVIVSREKAADLKQWLDQ